MLRTKKIIYLPNCQSTNTEALQRIRENNGEEGTIIHTYSQKNGRGQHLNYWESEDYKNLTFSVIVKPTFLPPINQFQLSISTSLAISEYLSELTGEFFTIKWPNDIYYGKKKVGGMLIENIIKGNTLSFSVLGIGLNINQVSFNTKNAISLKNITNLEYELESILTCLTDYILDTYSKLKNNKTNYTSLYYDKLLFFEQWTTYRAEDEVFTARIKGISDYGHLILEKTDNSIHKFANKEVVFLF